ncbi:TetR family transcriptional regulator [Cryobacterium sp. TMT1-21]|uniref:TetR family transcriptional regulator n=1 Tax=Cryobacterium shii TaxID=1259235 RepID=A0AAQ2C3R0_9MICO|nr:MULTISPECIES: TetR/AcrR family transcriptional regulator [Cryobacterium]TFC40962.1 TetR family transcriptional regulator [Cryobacterium shii]TFC87805.1 TetR family transcriptional regulator [Cryobacterium sp. TmT2-59]TFD12439.1 TetR family transcriptional regulator [Cryobacterium sp. TMT1-21]TFD19379.1 TetR family transcriptional regulator [Cryobacterium sp. TMT2-23]TFD19881.1 TetR family transcriptional regulator [Cryobacterium sp. TMT4-10]
MSSPVPDGPAGADEGLRARKRAATQSALERAAVSLALEHGYDNVTVDMICEAAMVSPRTFFNYFGTKEGAFLGGTPPAPTDAEHQAFVHGTSRDVLGDLVGMIADAMADHSPDTDLLRRRRMLIERTPELLTGETSRIAELEEHLVKLVLERFAVQGRTEARTPDLADEARMVVSLAGSVMRYSMQKWFSGGFTGTPVELLHHSLALVRRVAGSIAPAAR